MVIPSRYVNFLHITLEYNFFLKILFEDDETRFNSAFCVNKLAVYDDNIAILGDSGFIPLLVDVVNTGGKDAVAQACAALRHFAMRIENR